MRFFLLLLIAAMTFASCSNNSPDNKNDSALSQKDYEAFALRLDSAMNAGNAAFFPDNMNIPVLIDSATAQRKVKSGQDEAARKKFESEFTQGIKDIGRELVNAIKDGGSYKLLRVYTKSNAYHALFRMSSLEGLNYHDVLLGEVNGKVMISDIYIYQSGEDLSVTLGKLIDGDISGEDGGTGEEDAGEMEKLDGVRALAQQGMYEDAYKMIEGFPEETRKVKSIQLMKLEMAVQLGDDVYLEALKEYEALYPHDPSLDLILVGAFLVNEEYGKALLSVNKLDSTVKDPYLDAYRANIYYLMEDLPKAESYMLKAIANVKDADLPAYVALAAIYLEQEKYKETVDVLKTIQTNFKKPKEEVASLFADYEAFTSSEEFEKWLNENS